MSRYQSLLSAIHAFSEERLRADEFSTIYSDLFASAVSLPSEHYQTLNRLFYAAEDFCAEPGRRQNDLIGPKELLAAARAALSELADR